MSEHLTLVEALAIHQDQLRRYGGAPGVRDLGLLEAALHRPQTGYYAGLVQEAAALWESLSQNHPFVDGNKRVAFAVTDVFLRLNGWRLRATWAEVHAFAMARYEEGAFTFPELEAWLREHAAPEGL